MTRARDLKYSVMSGIAATLAAAVFVAPSPVQAFQAEGTVRIGLLETQTGTYAPYGLANLQGTLIAIDEINAAGGVTVGGQQVRIDVVPSPNGYDAGNDPAQTISLVRRLAADDNVLMIKGLSNSNAGIAVFNYLAELEAQGAPLVVHSSSVGTPDITKLSSYAFRNAFIENEVVVGLTHAVAEEFDVKTAALLIIRDNPYYVSISDNSIIPALEELGIDVVAKVEAATSDQDFSRQVNALRSANPDLIYVMTPTLSGLNFMKEARRRQLAPKAYIGNISLVTSEVLQSGSDAVEGMISAAGYDPNAEAMANFAAEYQRRYGQEINMFSVTGYEAGFLIADAIERSGIDNLPETLQADRTKFRDAFAQTAIESPTGDTVAFDENGDTPKTGVYVVARDGEFVLWNPADQ